MGLQAHKVNGGLFVNKHKYTKDLIVQTRLQNSTHVDTPLELNVKYQKDDGNLLAEPTICRKLVGSLIYLTITRPEISHAVNLVSQFMTLATQIHFPGVKRFIRYLLGTPERGIFFP